MDRSRMTSISTHDWSAGSSGSPLIGRRREIARLDRSLLEAIAGRPQLVLIRGEVGVGKSRLLHELRSIARHGPLALDSGRGCEGGGLPYLPFVEVFAGLLEELSANLTRGLEADLRIVRAWVSPEAGSSGSAELDGADGIGPDGDRERMGLFLAASRVLMRSTKERGRVLLLDDLQWFDRSSLDLLQHLVYAASSASARAAIPLLIAATCRPTDAGDSLEKRLARLEREEICTTIELSGLTASEVAALLRARLLSRPSQSLASTVHQATGGNPLFVRELAHHLTVRGVLVQRGGRLAIQHPEAELHLPPDLTSAVAARTASLGEGCLRALTLASCLGNRFSLASLCTVTGLEEMKLLDIVEEAIEQRLLVSDGEWFEFTHPLIRHSFYGRSSDARRQRLHLQIAGSLTGPRAERPVSHLMEIAHHLVCAGECADPGEVLDFARRAADHAFAIGAWSEAARYSLAALGAAPDKLASQERADLHYRAALAYYRDSDAGPCLDQCEHAIRLGHELDDPRSLARALLEKTRVQITLAPVPYGTLADVAPLEGLLEEVDDALHGRILTLLAEAYWTAREPQRAIASARRALEIGERTQDASLRSQGYEALALAQTQTLELREAADNHRRAIDWGRRAGDAFCEGCALQRLPVVLFWLGRLDEAAALAERACAHTDKTHTWGGHSMALAAQVSIAVARGRFGEAEAAAREAMRMVERSGYPWGGYNALPALACAHFLKGESSRARSAIEAVVEPGRLFEEPGPAIQLIAGVYRQLMATHSGVSVEVRRQLVEGLSSMVPPEAPEIGALPAFCALVEIADLIDAPELTAGPSQVLDLARERGATFSSGWVFLISRILGVAAALREEWSDAETHLEAAIDTASRLGALPELGRSCLDLARMLCARGDVRDRDRAAERVAQALELFEKLEMPLFERRAEELAAELPGSSSEGSARQGLRANEAELLASLEKTPFHRASDALEADAELGPLVILMTDIEGSTELIDRLGDRQARELTHEHNAILRACLRESNGAELQHTGDGIMASLTSALSGVSCAIAIQRTLARRNRGRNGPPIRVRIGLTAGEPIPEEGRLFGAAVNAAARICAHARPGQVLVSDVIVQLAAGVRSDFTALDPVVLKGFSKPFQLYEVHW